MIILATLFTQGRNIMLKQKIKYLSLIATAVIALAACNDNSEKDNPNKKEITIGFGLVIISTKLRKGLYPSWKRRVIKSIYANFRKIDK